MKPQLPGMEFFGVRILGLNPETLRKVVLSLAVLAVVLGVRAELRTAAPGTAAEEHPPASH